jgi:hypothetical protein
MALPRAEVAWSREDVLLVLGELRDLGRRVDALAAGLAQAFEWAKAGGRAREALRGRRRVIAFRTALTWRKEGAPWTLRARLHQSSNLRTNHPV